MQKDPSSPARPFRSIVHWVPLALLLGIAPTLVAAQADATEAPPNSHAKSYGDGWECDRGFRRVNQSCVAVEVPPNAYLDPSGGRWECSRGYRKV
ncbi:MAG: hypothetical protein P8Y26_11840 [Gemmatimonadales bacterium]